jgi:M6 family metalloprotease-like protein
MKLSIKNFLFLVLVYIYIYSLPCFSQENQPLCLDNYEEKLEINTLNPAFGPVGTLKMLVIFCKFSDDHFDLSPYTDIWPSNLNTLPSWATSILAPSANGPYSHPSVSGYFYDMSRGQFKVVGDVFNQLYIPEHPQSYYYLSSGRHIGYLTEEILMNLDPYIDYSDYDNWDPNDIDRDGIKNEPDGIVDMIAIVFRVANTLELDYKAVDSSATTGYQGISCLTGFRHVFGSGADALYLDDVNILATPVGSGTFQQNVFDPHGCVRIMAHEIGHYLFGRIHYELGDFSLMDGRTAGVMSAYERELLGWITDLVIITTNQINVRIPDGITHGKVFKVPIPSRNDYFLIENRQRISYYLKDWRKYNNGPFVNPGTGILIIRYPRVECADGRWNWKRVDFYWPNCQQRGLLYTYPFIKTTINRDSFPGYLGLNEMELKYKNVDSFNCKIVKSHSDCLGDSNDLFNLNYNQVFSPWSNPSTNLITILGKDTNKICIELVTKNANGDFYLNVFLSNPEASAPSKPQNLNVFADEWNQAVLTWEANIEPDVIDGGKYKILRAEMWGNANPTSYDLIDIIDAYSEGTPITSYTDYESYIYNGPRRLYYRIIAVDNTGKESVPSDEVFINGRIPKNPTNYENSSHTAKIYLCSPNPFNSTTKVKFETNEYMQSITINLFDILGRLVREVLNESKEAGLHEITIDLSDLPSGIYFVYFNFNGISNFQKILLLK